MEQAIACLADKQMSGKLAESEITKLNKKLAAIIKANYTDEGLGCISCNSTFAVCPHCTVRYLENALIFEVSKNVKNLWHLWAVIPRKLSYLFSYSSAFNY